MTVICRALCATECFGARSEAMVKSVAGVDSLLAEAV